MTSENTTRTSINIIKDLEQLSHTEGFTYAFCGLVVRSLWMPESELGIVNWSERLNYQELSFLLGLMVRRPIGITYVPPKENVIEMITSAEELLAELHRAVDYPGAQPSQEESGQSQDTVFQDFTLEFEAWSNSGQGMVEPIFYSGADAFSNQYLNFLTGIHLT